MAVADWTVPFELTSQVYSGTLLPFNQAIAFANGTGYYRLRTDGCALTNVVRQTKDDVPQAPGSILHRRWVAGMEMNLAIQMWGEGTIACDELLQEMLDEIMGYLYGLLNAGDNQGRISWTPASINARMLDDIRLLSYPVATQAAGSAYELTFSIDCEQPYALDLTQQYVQIADGATVVITNNGNCPFYPVLQVNMVAYQVPDVTACTGISILNEHPTGSGITEEFVWTASQPGSQQIPANQFADVNCFRNTMFKSIDGITANDANMTPGIVMPDSEYIVLYPGTNSITVAGGPVGVLWNPSWV